MVHKYAFFLLYFSKLFISDTKTLSNTYKNMVFLIIHFCFINSPELKRPSLY